MAYVPNYSNIGQYKGKVQSRFSRDFRNREIVTYVPFPNYGRMGVCVENGRSLMLSSHWMTPKIFL